MQNTTVVATYLMQPIPRYRAILAVASVTIKLAEAHRRIKLANQRQKAAVDLSNDILKKAWAHLPNEVKNEINTNTAFHNLILEEGLL